MSRRCQRHHYLPHIWLGLICDADHTHPEQCDLHHSKQSIQATHLMCSMQTMELEDISVGFASMLVDCPDSGQPAALRLKSLTETQSIATADEHLCLTSCFFHSRTSYFVAVKLARALAAWWCNYFAPIFSKSGCNKALMHVRT